jgi:hydrogenase nickel incorporation protein HypA/HybF
MHEAGIAASILEIAEKVRAGRDAAYIAAVRVRVGEFSGVVADSLQFAFDALKSGTLAQKAFLEIESVPVAAVCRECGREAQPESNLNLWCPHCQGPLEITSGQELDVVYVDLEGDEAPAWSESA